MGKFLTGKARLQQTDRKRIFKLLDNVVYRANDGKIYLAPRNMYTDGYTIPLWISWLAGSPIDYDVRCCAIHDQLCYNHQALMINLTELELMEKGYLRYSKRADMWVCEDVPAEFLCTKKVSKCFANNMLFDCMLAADESFIDSFRTRFGTIFNIGWYKNLIKKVVFKLELDKVYREDYWREKTAAYK